MEGCLASWDIFHADRLELSTGVSTDAIREGLAHGTLNDDDLIRPAGTTVAWGRIADIPELMMPLEQEARVAASDPAGPNNSSTAGGRSESEPAAPRGGDATTPAADRAGRIPASQRRH